MVEQEKGLADQSYGGETHDLNSLLCSSDRDFLIRNNGEQVPVSDLVGKKILLYFSAHWCPPCCALLPKLIDAYNKIKAKDEAFEVIFISSDVDQNSFGEYFLTMPWLAVPFGDELKKYLTRLFKVQGIPTAVAIAPTGKTVTTDTIDLLMSHGADAYPFSDERIKEIDAKQDEMSKGWPETINHALHPQHDLVLTRRSCFICDGCEQEGQVWSFYCEECDYDLHPRCALEEKESENNANADVAKQEHKEGWTCDGNVCRKA